MTAIAATQRDEHSRWVSFQLAGQLYGIAILQVQEVLSSADIEPVPGAPHQVLGVINLRGSIITVLELRSCLNLPSLTTAGIIVIVTHGTQVVGFRVDGVADVLNIANPTIQPPPDTSPNPNTRCISGLVSRKNGVLTLLDVPKLLGQQMPA